MQYKQEKQSIAIIKRMYSKMSSESDGLDILEQIFDLSANASPEFKAFLDSIQKLVIHKMEQYPGVSYRDALAQYKVDETHTALDLLEEFSEALQCASYDDIVFTINFLRYEKERISAFGVCALLNLINKGISYSFVAYGDERLEEFKEIPTFVDGKWVGEGSSPLSTPIKRPDDPRQWLFGRKDDTWHWIGKDV